jgi:hypothetical protein
MIELSDRATILGQLAADCDLLAADPTVSTHDRCILMLQAAEMREAQLESCPPLHRCHTSGCPNVVAGDDYCARCAEEMSGQPYTLANILSEFPKRAHRLFWTAVFAAAAVVLSILLILF